MPTPTSRVRASHTTSSASVVIDQGMQLPYSEEIQTIIEERDRRVVEEQEEREIKTTARYKVIFQSIILDTWDAKIDYAGK